MDVLLGNFCSGPQAEETYLPQETETSAEADFPALHRRDRNTSGLCISRQARGLSPIHPSSPASVREASRGTVPQGLPLFSPNTIRRPSEERFSAFSPLPPERSSQLPNQPARPDSLAGVYVVPQRSARRGKGYPGDTAGYSSCAGNLTHATPARSRETPAYPFQIPDWRGHRARVAWYQLLVTGS
jgi:hypothetical protein